MKTVIGKAALAAVFALGAGAASAGVTVKFVNPEKFTDLPTTDWERREVLQDLSAYFGKLGRQLPAGQELNVEITNIDLFGRGYPSVNAREWRVARTAAEWPTMSLRYTISADGRVIDSGTEQLKDMEFHARRDVRPEDGNLRYEKRMIKAWFRETIVQKSHAARMAMAQ